jgi:transposase
LSNGWSRGRARGQGGDARGSALAASWGDKGYSSHTIRQYLHKRGIRSTIPRKQHERRTGRFDRTLYRLRNRVERLINRLKQFRRVATRYKKRAHNYAAMWTLAVITLWLWFENTP